jgi:hypothetical protein
VTLRRILITAGGGALLVAAAIGASRIADAAPGPHEERGAPANEPPPKLTDAITNRSPEEQARDRAHNAGLAPTDALEQQVANNRIKVSGPNGFAGYIDNDALNSPYPTSVEDLHPVRNHAGNLVAYWGGPFGVLDKDLVESGRFDFAAERAKIDSLYEQAKRGDARPTGAN